MGLEIDQSAIEQIRAKHKEILAPPRYELRDVRELPTKKGGKFKIIEVWDSRSDLLLEFFEREIYSIDAANGIVHTSKTNLAAASKRALARLPEQKQIPQQPKLG